MGYAPECLSFCNCFLLFGLEQVNINVCKAMFGGFEQCLLSFGFRSGEKAVFAHKLVGCDQR